MGRIIAFSGLDGAGKSTQIRLLGERLEAAGHRTTELWIRGGYTPGIERLKRIARALLGQKLPPPGPSERRRQAFRRTAVRWLWIQLAVLDLIWLTSVRVRWLRWRGYVVLCDRYVLDSRIDFQLNFPGEDVSRWRSWRIFEALAPVPDAAFVMVVPVEESLRRSDIKGEPFRDSVEALKTRLEHYLTAADNADLELIDGQGASLDIATRISRLLEGERAR